MKTRTDLRAGDALQTCKMQKENWKSKAENMQRVLANCHPYNPPNPPNPPPPTPPPAGGGWVGGVWVPDRSGICG
jgi:hypothetical protein